MQNQFRHSRPVSQTAHANGPRQLARRIKTAAGDIIFLDNRVGERLTIQRGLIESVWRCGSRLTEELPKAMKRARYPVTATFQEVIGLDSCVETPRIGLDDKTEFVVIPGHHEPIRVVTDIDPHPTHNLTMILDWNPKGAYHVVAAWFGRQTERSPIDIKVGDPFSATKELDFWLTHALAHDPAWERPWTSTWRQVIDDTLHHER